MGALCSKEDPRSPEEKEKARTAELDHHRRQQKLRNNVIAQSADEIPEKKYEIVKRLGVGSMGSVDLVRRRKSSAVNGTYSHEQQNEKQQQETGKDQPQEQLYALKTLRLGRVTKLYMKELLNEIQIVSDLDHPGIVKFYQIYHADTTVHIIMELCSGGDLYKRDPYTEHQAADIVQQVLSAIAYMHRRNYVHRDIKFENIMFESPTSNKIKIIDFGLSGRYDPQRPLHAQYGTIYTMAPEVIEGSYDAKCDVWSIGVVAFELLCSEKPFQSSSIFILQEKIANAEYNFSAPGWKRKSKLSKQFCQDLLKVSPKRRPSSVYAQKHAWLLKQQQRHQHEEEKIEIGQSSEEEGTSFMQTESERERWLEYSRSPALQKIASLLVAHRSFAAQVAELRALFERVDTGKTGYISWLEFKKAFDKYSGDEREVKAIFNGLDILHDGQVSYTEFLAACLSIRGFITEDKVLEAFEQLDVDHSGKITLENLQSILGRDFPPEEASKIIAEIDLTHDGMIALDELVSAFRKNTDAVAEKAFVAVGMPNPNS